MYTLRNAKLVVDFFIIILCELVPSTSEQLVDHQQKPLMVISGH